MRGIKPPPFFQKPCYSVQGEYGKTGKLKQPKIKITASEEQIIINILAKSGYFQGNPETVLNTRGDIVIDTFHYEMFTRNCENAFYELNEVKQGK